MVCAFLLFLAADAPAASATAKAPPHAEAKLPFGAPSDLVFTSGTAIRFSATAPMLATQPAAAMKNPDDFSGEATFALAVDYFVVKKLSVGAFLRAGYSWSPSMYGPGFGLGPRVGYHMSFSEWVGLWPRLDLSFGAQGFNARNSSAENAIKNTSIWFFNATVNLPLVFTILDHVILGIGPYFAFEPQWADGQKGLAAFALNFGLASFFGWHF